MTIENIKKATKVTLAIAYKFKVKKISNVAITRQIKTP
ncbi:MAG: hypothetical protein ACI93V_000521 [Alteromonadaceae bacterium]|jgi:hypothetical protein|tara:strand:- start:1224 stop:1337 length:114 start_codon:yes stop_codon:yes gene_type:complete